MVGLSGFAALVVMVLLLTFSVLTVKPAASASIEYPVSIPPECVDLAQRRGEPLVLENRNQAMRAKAKLWTLPRWEPGVLECRAAVRRLQEQVKAQ